MTEQTETAQVRSAGEIRMRLEEEICTLISETQDLNFSEIPRIKVPTPLEFHRYVAANRPVIITLPRAETPSADQTLPTDASTNNSSWDWRAFTHWTNDYISKKLGSKQITVACTPNGWADAVVDDKYFAMPCERKMTFSEFLSGMPGHQGSAKGRSLQEKTCQDIKEDVETIRGLRKDVEACRLESQPAKTSDSSPQEVRYIQLQNGNLMTEYEELMDDVPMDIPFSSEALGRTPDAVNFWYGNDQSKTSLHKDHYENIYAVISGCKVFTLIPPTEQFCLHEKQYIAATYVQCEDEKKTSGPGSASNYRLEPLEPLTMTRWIALNPSHEPEEEIFDKYPRYQFCQPFKVVLHPGELLYLPAMWYHQVEQEADEEGKCIAVNWWYDMGYEGDRFMNSTFMSNLIKLVDQIDGPRPMTTEK